MQTKVFYFNPYRECTYVLWDADRHAVIIDAGMLDEREQRRFRDFIESEQLSPVALLITHAHPDHVCGLEWLQETYHLSPVIYPAEGVLDLPSFAERIEVLRTLGHKEDCVCYFMPSEKMLFSGDTLFQESIGRTDLPEAICIPCSHRSSGSRSSLRTHRYYPVTAIPPPLPTK